MGSLLRFPLSETFVARFPTFIETGYGDGRSLRYAAVHSFETLTSIELWPDSVRKGRRDFADDLRVSIIHGHSASQLNHLLRFSLKPTFFWLDAHFPGTDYNHPPTTTEPDEYIRLPLRYELDIIRELMPGGNYFIAIDDLRFYSDLAWGDGLIPAMFHSTLPKERNLDFLNPFRATHRVEIDLHDSGYALIGPHDATFLEFKE